MHPDVALLRNSLSRVDPAFIAECIEQLDDADALQLGYDWQLFARDDQLPPECRTSSLAYTVWLILAGRGWGKTRTGAEWVRHNVDQKLAGRIALVGPTAADVRDVMIEGESGLIATAPPWNRPVWEPSKRRLTWPSGTIAFAYSAEEPERLRGPQHDLAWADELAAWARLIDTWDMLMFGLRLGKYPRVAVTTTPKPLQIIREMMGSASTFITKGSTYDNRDNLAESFFTQIVKRYEGTRLGRQELNAEILDDNPNGLWSPGMIEAKRLPVEMAVELMNTCDRIVVGVDPAVTSNSDSDETGIVIAGRRGDDGFVFDDSTVRASPNEWAQVVVTAYKRWNADRVVAEVNNGGDLVTSVMHNIDRNLPVEAVRATRGKIVRAEPIAALYEQGRIHHVGDFAKLEDQMVNYNPLYATRLSPDRLDALVWALSHLFNENSAEPRIRRL